MQPTYERQSKTKLVAIIATIIVIAGIVVIADHLKSSSSSVTPTPSATTSQPATNSSGDNSTSTDTTGGSSSSTSGYKDGTYTASSSYFVPHGNEEIDVTLTLKDGVVTSSSITNSEGDHDSAAYQEDFTSAYKSYVVGQKITDLQLGVIAGASDTTQGFNDAVSQIASKAQA